MEITTFNKTAQVAFRCGINLYYSERETHLGAKTLYNKMMSSPYKAQYEFLCKNFDNPETYGRFLMTFLVLSQNEPKIIMTILLAGALLMNKNRDKTFKEALDKDYSRADFDSELDDLVECAEIHFDHPPSKRR
jgi:hypothetical protein